MQSISSLAEKAGNIENFMSHYQASVNWVNSGPNFLNGQYSREHKWIFEGGSVIKATAAPDIVPEPWSNPANVDPEAAFVASLSSCHMLFFLSFAARQGILVESYEDHAIGFLETNEQGKKSMTRVILRPSVACSNHSTPSQESLRNLHRAAHEHCFIANSVTTDVTIEPADTD